MESSFEFTGSRLWLSCEGPWNLTYKSAQTPLCDGHVKPLMARQFFRYDNPLQNALWNYDHAAH